MAVFPLKLCNISKVLFVIIIVSQGCILSKYIVDHKKSEVYFGIAPAFIALSLFTWVGTLCFGQLKNRLGIVWFFYMVALVVMVGWIFGDILINHNKLREETVSGDLCEGSMQSVKNSSNSNSFFDSKFLKITLCFTPGEMLLLLTSVSFESGTFQLICFTAVMDLFDGIEMLEVLNEDVCNKIPKVLEFIVLAATLLSFLLSSFEVHQVKFDENGEPKARDKTSLAEAIFQIVLNVFFLVIRLMLWLSYGLDSAIFIAKNIIGLAVVLVPVLESDKCGIITRKP